MLGGGQLSPLALPAAPALSVFISPSCHPSTLPSRHATALRSHPVFFSTRRLLSPSKPQNANKQTNLRQLVKTVATQVHNQGGVVRDFKAIGRNVTLPTRMRRNQQYHTHGE
jgi:hypothetical protein